MPTFERLKEVVFKRIVATQNPKHTADDGVNFLIDFWNQHQQTVDTQTN